MNSDVKKGQWKQACVVLVYMPYLRQFVDYTRYPWSCFL